MPRFDVRDEPWIPVVRCNGARAEMSLRAVLHDAHDLQEISDPMPTVEFGLYRLLVAFVMDIHQLSGLGGLERLLERGRFDQEGIDAYFEEWAPRFDLFDSQYPFLQTGGMVTEAEKPLAAMLHCLPSGTNVSHFHHVHEDAFGCSPAAAARLLTPMAPFMTAGGAGLAPSINGAPPWYVVLVSQPGATLFKSLCLNCCVQHLPQAQGNEPPAWRSSRSPIPGQRCTSASLAESLTWRPRQIQLVPGEGGRCALTGRQAPILVRRMKFSAGASCDFAWRDPSVPYRTNDKGTSPLRPQEGKDAWRDTGPIALLQQDEYSSKVGKIRFDRPALVEQFGQMVRDEILPPRSCLTLHLYGLRTDLKMKIFEWRSERLSLPAALVWRRKFHADAQRAMEEAETVAYLLRKSTKHVYPREGKGNSGAFETIIGACHRQFWNAMRSPYSQVLEALAHLPAEGAETQVHDCRDGWKNDLKAAASVALEAAISDLDATAQDLQRQVEARRIFWGGFNRLFDPTPATGAMGGGRPRASKLKGAAVPEQPQVNAAKGATLPL